MKLLSASSSISVIVGMAVLLLLSPLVAVVTGWAGCHADRDKDHRPRENCTALGFTDVPAGFEPTTKVLLFPSNQFSSLPWSSFTYFTEIYEIDLTRNQVPEVPPSAGPILPSLSVLRLGYNRLSSLPPSAFSASPSLTELYLDHNIIATLSDSTFTGLHKLEILDLSSNHIKSLPALMLHPLPAIETLLLEDNKIKLMPDKWFSEKEEVPYLYLSANPWACFCSSYYFNKYLDEYSYNVYVRDGKDIKNDEESVVCASPAALQGRPLVKLEEFDLCTPDGSDAFTVSTTVMGPAGDFYQPITTTQTPPMAPSTTAPLPPTTKTHTTAFPTTQLPTTTTTQQPTTALPTTPSTISEDPRKVSTTFTHFYHPITTEIPTVAAPTFVPRLPTTTSTEIHTSTAHLPAVYTPHTIATTPTPPTIWPTIPFIHTFPDATHFIVQQTTTATTESVPSTVTVTTTTTTQKPRVVTATTTPTPTTDPINHHSSSSGRGSGLAPRSVFCSWLFAGFFLLCLASLASILATCYTLFVWYGRAYKPLRETLARRRKRGLNGRGGGESLRLLTYENNEAMSAAGGGVGVGIGGVVGGGGGVLALYRSVLFVNREAEAEGQESQDGGGDIGSERVLVNLKPTTDAKGLGIHNGRKGDIGGNIVGDIVGATGEGDIVGATGGDIEGDIGGGGRVLVTPRNPTTTKAARSVDERGLYKKTLYRVWSKDEAIDGWRDVVEEECMLACGGEEEGERGRRRVMRGRDDANVDGGMSGGGAGGSRKVYSVILREERERDEAGLGAGKEQVEWVVGGWEVGRGGGKEGEGGGAEDRSSWGEWLAHYLPSMPWGLATPTERDSAQ